MITSSSFLKSNFYIIVALASILGSVIATPHIANFANIANLDPPGFTQTASAQSLPHQVDHHVPIRERTGDPVRVETQMTDADRNCEMSCIFVEFTPGRNGKAGLAYVGDSPMDLSGARRVHFFLMGDKGGEMVKVYVAGKSPSSGQNASGQLPSGQNASGLRPDSLFKEKFAKTGAITLTNDWERYEISLAGVDLTGITAPFAIELLKGRNSAPQAVYFKFIVYENLAVDPRFELAANTTNATALTATNATATNATATNATATNATATTATNATAPDNNGVRGDNNTRGQSDENLGDARNETSTSANNTTAGTSDEQSSNATSDTPVEGSLIPEVEQEPSTPSSATDGEASPVASNVEVTTNQDTPVPITLQATDEDPGDSLTFSVSEAANGGEISEFDPQDGTLTYTPPAGFSGQDAFNFKAVDSRGVESNTATVTITVNAAANQAPVASNEEEVTTTTDQDAVNNSPVASNVEVTTNQDTPVPITLQATDEDPGDSLTFSVSEAANGGEISEFDPQDGTLTYTPPAGFSGQDAFNFKAVDSRGVESNTATVTITINKINQPPIANAGIDATVNERTRGYYLDGTGSSDPDGQVTQYIWRQTSGTAVTLDTTSNPGYAIFNVPNVRDSSTKLTFELIVQDNDGAQSQQPDTVVITINDLRPTSSQPRTMGYWMINTANTCYYNYWIC